MAKPKIRRATHSPISPKDRLAYASLCVEYLGTALDYARSAGAPYMVKRLESAMASARGAVRNAGYRVTREQMER